MLNLHIELNAMCKEFHNRQIIAVQMTVGTKGMQSSCASEKEHRFLTGTYIMLVNQVNNVEQQQDRNKVHKVCVTCALSQVTGTTF